MAQQKFTNSFREALWETYGKRCFHCTGELLLVDMRVDHIVPEHLHHGDPAGRIAALTEIGLPEDFNICGHGNLAPSCEKCNGQKSGSILIGRAVAVSLTRIQRSLVKLEENLRKKRKARDLEDMLRAVARSVDSGLFTPEEFLTHFSAVLRDKAIADGSNLACQVGIPTLPKLPTKKFVRHPLLFMPQARAAMQDYTLDPDDIADELFFSLMSGSAGVVKLQVSSELSNHAYALKLQGNLYMLFAVTEQAVAVIAMIESKEA